jgi:hypothetical protein
MALLQFVRSSPEAGATGVATDVDVELVFDRDIVAAAGRFSLHRTLDDGTFESVEVTSTQVSLEGAVMSVDLDGVLAGDTAYYVTLDADAVEGSDGSGFAGVVAEDGLGFTTAAVTVPGAVAEPWLWFDAAFAGSIKSDAAGVAVWGDRSGNNSTLRQSDLAARPSLRTAAIGSNPAVSFDGTSDVLEGPALEAWEAYDVFVVWQSPVEPPTDNNTHLLRNGPSVEINHGHQQAPFRHAGAARFSTWVPAQFEAPATNTPYLWNLSFDSTTRTLTSFTDAIQSATANAPDAVLSTDDEPFTVGSDWGHPRYFTGDIGEIIVYRRALSPTERASVQEYLDGKWSL